MKTRIEVTWPKLTGDDTAKMFRISAKRRNELRQIAKEAADKIAARDQAARVKTKKVKAA